MLEWLVAGLEIVSRDPLCSKRTVITAIPTVAIPAAFTAIANCARAEPSRFNPNKTELAAIINDPHSGQEQYVRAVNRWPNQDSIWPILTSKLARERFARVVTLIDTIDLEKYLYDDPDDQKYNPCSETNFKQGRSDPGFRHCLEERTKGIDADNPMTCRHFTRKFMWKYGKEGKLPPFSQSHPRYKVAPADRKYLMPLREIEIIFPEKITPDSLGIEIRERPRPHAVIGIWLGNKPLSQTAKEETVNYQNWYIFDPQTDARILNPPYDVGQVNPGNVILIYPEHEQPLDQATPRPLEVEESSGYSSTLAFTVNANRYIIPATFLGSRYLTQFVYEHAAHHKNLAPLLDYFHLTFSTPGLSQLVLKEAQFSGNFTEMELKSLQGWDTFLRSHEALSLSSSSHNIIKTFLANRETFFERPGVVNGCSEPGFKPAFQYLERQGMLTYSESLARIMACPD